MDFDIIIIGSGPGGYVAAIRAAQLGMNVAVIEKESLGGICLNWGCIPTKALLKSAAVYENLCHAQDYGIMATGIAVDYGQVHGRSRQVAEKMSKGVAFLMKKNKITVIEGTATVLPNKQVQVVDAQGQTQVHQANHIILATGAHGRSLPSAPIDGQHILGYRDVLTLNTLPKSVLVMGSGAIGAEFSYLMNAMGVQVHLVEALDRLAPNEDADLSAQLEKSFKKQGIKTHTQTKVIQVQINPNGVEVDLETPKGPQTLTVEKVISAVGIVPNIENIGLESLGIAIENGKVVVDEYGQTNVLGYYAIGDITHGPALAHVASAEGILCVEKIAGLDVHPINYDNIPACTYCQPEMASVGLTEAAAKEKNIPIKVGKFPFSASGKASANGQNDGFVKVILDAQYGEWLGCHIIGYGATELIAEAVVARNLETTGHEILKSIHPHPTMSEAIMEAMSVAYDEAIHI